MSETTTAAAYDDGTATCPYCGLPALDVWHHGEDSRHCGECGWTTACCNACGCYSLPHPAWCQKCPPVPSSPSAASERREEWGTFADAVVQRVCDLDPTDYPDDAPDTLRVSADDLRAIVCGEIAARLAPEVPGCR